jgi:hypothetical protein
MNQMLAKILLAAIDRNLDMCNEHNVDGCYDFRIAKLESLAEQIRMGVDGYTPDISDHFTLAEIVEEALQLECDA